MTADTLLIALFISLSCFVVINLMLSVVLWKYSKHPIYQKIVKYWGSTVIFFAFQFFFPHTHIQIVLAFGFGILPMLYVYTLVYNLLGAKTKVKNFLVFHFLAVCTTLILWNLDFGFTAIALPISASISLPLLFSIKTIFISKRSQATLLQQLLGGLLVFWVPHCFTFSFFRMVEGTQFFGWVTSYTLYDIMAILLPAIAIEESFKTEKIRLETQVQARTDELSHALSDKETLLKILVHDISNPLTVMRWYLTGIKKNPNQDFHTYIDKVLKSQEIVENIVKKVRVLQTEPKSQNIVPISFLKCIEELHFVFEKALLAKNITLTVTDETNGLDTIMADQFSLTHNILSNFVNNSIKFSFPDSDIKIIVSHNHESLQVRIQDSGLGMSAETIQNIFSDKEIQSAQGTHGEDGTGFGLSIAKNILKDFGGRLEIQSQEYSKTATNHGTTIILNFPLIKNTSVTKEV
ncbi:MAG: HAMP domain-containing sensor histidine kinase [Bacteriovoracaceae bacterium]